MSRKDTIIFAVVINIGLLVFLFATAMQTTEDKTVVAVQEPVELQMESILQKSSQVVSLLDSKGTDEKEEIDYLLTSLPKKEIVEVEALPLPFSIAMKKEDSKVKEQLQEHFVEVTVKRGDILDRIARANGVTVEEIMEINNLLDTRLQIGQVLKIALKPALASAPSSSEVITSPLEENIYIVRSGDNPWTIAMRHRMNLDELLKMNDLNEEKARRLKPGDRLRVR